MGTFTLDPYKDMTLDQVKKRCRELSRELFRWECIALAAYEGRVDGLPEEDRSALKMLKAAYED